MSLTKKSLKSTGRLFGIGVGPGDPDLITLKAYKVLSRIPVILVPQKDKESGSLAYSVIQQYITGSEQKVESLIFPMSKSEAQTEPYWEKAAECIWGYLSSGKDCAFITIGDSLLYGTFIYVIEKLKLKHPDLLIEIIPGISSVNAAAAASLMPLASHDERVAILSAERDDSFIRETLQQYDTVVFLKVNAIFDRLLNILTELQLAHQAVYVRNCSTSEQEIVRDILKLKGQKLDYFSILLVRKKPW